MEAMEDDIMMEQHVAGEKRNLWIIGVLSIAIPMVVAVLLFMPAKLDLAASWAQMLPGLNAVMNSATSLALIAGFIFIRKGEIKLHRFSMMSAFILGSIFLVSYVIYHSTMPGTKFGDLDSDGLVSAAELAETGGLRSVYFVILISHIILAIVVVPFVLLAMYFAISKQFDKHKKIVRFAWPIWLYVSVTGVLVYLMISPYYPWN